MDNGTASQNRVSADRARGCAISPNLSASPADNRAAATALATCDVDTDVYHGPCVTAGCSHDGLECCGAPSCDGCDDSCDGDNADDLGAAYARFTADREAHS